MSKMRRVRTLAETLASIDAYEANRTYDTAACAESDAFEFIVTNRERLLLAERPRSSAYTSLTPRQQRVWDAAYGAAFARRLNDADRLTVDTMKYLTHQATLTADAAAASLEDHGSHSAD